jgi:hypothetical protein
MAQEWTIGEPAISFRGLQLIMVYELNTFLKSDDVSVSMFQDEFFRDEIGIDNSYLTPEIELDGTSGTQMVCPFIENKVKVAVQCASCYRH